MATAPPYVIQGPAGVRLYGGRLPPGGALGGTVALDSEQASGGIQSFPPSGLSGSATLEDSAASGGAVTGAGPTGTPSPLVLTSSTSGTLPFTAGYFFRQGDVPAGYGVAVTGANAQVTPKNYWPDGSLKIAIIAGTYTSAGSAVSVSMAAGTSSSGTALTTADLKATGVSATIDCGSFGSVTWAANSTDWDAPVRTWVSGHRMSSWTFRKPVGSDPHLVAWMEVRLYATGAVDVLPWVENGYMFVAGPTNKSATYGFTLGGTSRFSQAIDIPHHCRAVLVSGTNLSHWFGASDPGVIPRHDADYLAAAGFVPGFVGAVKQASFPALPTTNGFTTSMTSPLEQGDFRATMNAPGSDRAIGLLTAWDAAYLCSTSDTTNAFRAVVLNNYRHGRYGIHFRDEVNEGGLRPFKWTNWKNLGVAESNGGFGYSPLSGIGSVTTTAGTGTTPQLYDMQHQPAIGYIGYLATGRLWMVEELQMTCNTQYLARGEARYSDYPGAGLNGDAGLCRSYEDKGGGTIISLAPREIGWSLRTLFYAAAITPDNDTTAEAALRASYTNSVYQNALWFYNIHLAQPNHNFGIPITWGNGKNWYQCYQLDFCIAAWCQGAMLKLVSGSQATTVNRWTQWICKAIVGRMGGLGAHEFPYYDAAAMRSQYAGAPSNPSGPIICPTNLAADGSGDVITGTGPFHHTWGSIYQQTTGFAPSGTDLPLQQNVADAPGVWGSVHLAIGMAASLRVPGAEAAYDRLINASNYSTYTGGAVSSVAPNYACAKVALSSNAEVLTPAWVKAMNAGEWSVLPNSVLATSGVMQGTDGDYCLSSFSGSTLNTRGIYVGSTFIPGTFEIYWGVGHTPLPQGAYDEMYARGPYESDTPQWWRVRDRIGGILSTEEDAFGNPVSRHTYISNVYTGETRNKLTMVGGTYRAQDANPDSWVRTYAFNTPSPNTNMPWAKVVQVPGASPSYKVAYATAYDPGQQKVFYHPNGGDISGIGVLDLVANTVTVVSGKNYPIGNDQFSAAIDVRRGLFAQFGSCYGGTSAASFYRTNNGTANDYYAPNQSAGGPTIAGYSGATHNWKRDCFVVWTGGGKTFYRLTPPASNPYAGGSQWTWSTVTPATGATPTAQSGSGTFSKLQFFEVPGFSGMVLQNDRADPAYIFRDD